MAMPSSYRHTIPGTQSLIRAHIVANLASMPRVGRVHMDTDLKVRRSGNRADSVRRLWTGFPWYHLGPIQTCRNGNGGSAERSIVVRCALLWLGEESIDPSLNSGSRNAALRVLDP